MDRNKPKISKTAIIAPTSISNSPTPYHLECNCRSKVSENTNRAATGRECLIGLRPTKGDEDAVGRTPSSAADPLVGLLVAAEPAGRGRPSRTRGSARLRLQRSATTMLQSLRMQAAQAFLPLLAFF